MLLFMRRMIIDCRHTKHLECLILKLFSIYKGNQLKYGEDKQEKSKTLTAILSLHRTAKHYSSLHFLIYFLSLMRKGA